jgi:hypothetical protein
MNNEASVLQQELLRLGVELGVPDLIRSTSSNSSFSSFSVSSCESWNQFPEYISSSLPSSLSKSQRHKKPSSIKCSGSTSMLEVLVGVCDAVNQREMNHYETSEVDDDTNSAPEDSIEPPCSQRRSICPQHVRRSDCDALKRSKKKLHSWRSNAQTFPKTSFRKSSGLRSSESVSFSPDVNIVEYERDMVHHSSPEWSHYFT